MRVFIALFQLNFTVLALVLGNVSVAAPQSTFLTLCSALLTAADARLEQMEDLRQSSSQAHALAIATTPLETIIDPTQARAKVEDAIQALSDSPYSQARYRRTAVTTSLLFENDPLFARVQRELPNATQRRDTLQSIEELYPTYWIHPITAAELENYDAQPLHQQGMGPALLHRSFNEVLHELNGLKIRVFLDSGINKISTAGAWFSPEGWIHIGPHTPWKTFRHELTHARLYAALGDSGARTVQNWLKRVRKFRAENQGTQVSDWVLQVVTPEMVLRLKDFNVNLADIELLLRNEIPGLGFDESMATFSENAALQRDWTRLRERLCSALFTACQSRNRQNIQARQRALFATDRVIRRQDRVPRDLGDNFEATLFKARRVLHNRYTAERYRAENQVYALLEIPESRRTRVQIRSLRRALLRLEILENRITTLAFEVAS